MMSVTSTPQFFSMCLSSICLVPPLFLFLYLMLQ
uniref:Uncharacterized protein n=1 Tax=Rhizophora mucronata TaxID=61149 RepID=A0A2P2NTX0_RHIMU